MAGQQDYYFVDHDSKRCCFIGGNPRELAHAKWKFPTYQHEFYNYHKVFMDLIPTVFIPMDWDEKQPGPSPTQVKVVPKQKTIKVKKKMRAATTGFKDKNIRNTLVQLAVKDGASFAMDVAIGWKQTAIAAMEGADPMQRELIKLAFYNPVCQAILAITHNLDKLPK